MIKTAIVILNWNTRHHLETFLPSLIKYSTSPDISIILADNASTDSSVAFVKENYPQIGIIILDKNYGFAEGYNRALQQVEAEYFILLNSDIEVTDHWVAPLVNLLKTNPNIAACMPKLRSYTDRDAFEYAGAAGGYIDKLGYPFCKGRIFNTIEKDHGQYEGTYEVFWATGACLAIKADIFKQLGGFDSYFFAHQEEIDLCWRLQNQGYKIYYTSQSTIFHLGGGTLHKSNPRKTYLNFRNNLILLFKNQPNKTFRKTLPIRLVLDGVAAVSFLCKGNVSDVGAIFRAHMSFYKYMFQHRNLSNKQMSDHLNIYPKSIVYQYYILKKKVFSDL